MPDDAAELDAELAASAAHVNGPVSAILGAAGFPPPDPVTPDDALALAYKLRDGLRQQPAGLLAAVRNEAVRFLRAHGVPSPAKLVDSVLGRDHEAAARDSGAPFALTDLGNAERLVTAHHDSIRFHAHRERWLRYDGRRWESDEKGGVYVLAERVVRAIHSEAAAAPTQEQARAIGQWAVDSESKPRIHALVDLAAHQEGVAVGSDELDTNPWLLNCPNGTLDLRTGTLTQHQKSDLLTALCPTRYVPTAEAPVFQNFLLRIFADHEPLISFVLRLLGCSLTSDITEQRLPIWYGCGANGKSTLADILMETVGPDYSTPAPRDLLVLKRHDEHPAELADLMGKRLVIASETGRGRTLNMAQVKSLTGDTFIKARFMRQDWFTFRRTHKTHLLTNHKPTIPENSEAAWRRILLIPFAVTIPEAERDTRLLDKLRDEKEGILAALVQGCLDWHKHGLQPPGDVTQATAAYRAESNLVERFIEECCTLIPDGKATPKSLLSALARWAEEQGQRTPWANDVADHLRSIGCHQTRSNSGRFWSGIVLNRDPE